MKISTEKIFPGLDPRDVARTVNILFRKRRKVICSIPIFCRIIYKKRWLTTPERELRVTHVIIEIFQ